MQRATTASPSRPFGPRFGSLMRPCSLDITARPALSMAARLSAICRSSLAWDPAGPAAKSRTSTAATAIRRPTRGATAVAAALEVVMAGMPRRRQYWWGACKPENSAMLCHACRRVQDWRPYQNASWREGDVEQNAGTRRHVTLDDPECNHLPRHVRWSDRDPLRDRLQVRGRSRRAGCRGCGRPPGWRGGAAVAGEFALRRRVRQLRRPGLVRH